MTSFLKKSIVAGVAVLSLAGSTLATTAPASARNGGAIAAGVIGGLAVGAIAGSAAANANNGYGGYPAYGAAPVYAPAPAYGGCYFTRQPVYDEDGEIVGRRRVRVCE